MLCLMLSPQASCHIWDLNLIDLIGRRIATALHIPVEARVMRAYLFFHYLWYFICIYIIVSMTSSLTADFKVKKECTKTLAAESFHKITLSSQNRHNRHNSTDNWHIPVLLRHSITILTNVY